ncbi:Uncharacterised protein [Chlamydia abortus]|nr:Uncharacterised protein [Chlamydia abortus]
MDDVNKLFVKHTQEDGEDKLSIYTKEGVMIARASCPVLPGDSVESAVGAMFSGYDQACDLAPRFDAKRIVVQSNVPGVEERFGAMMAEIDELSKGGNTGQ